MSDAIANVINTYPGWTLFCVFVVTVTLANALGGSLFSGGAQADRDPRDRRQGMSVGKRYLGDGVYVDKWRSVGGYVLTTSDGLDTTNTVYLEPEVVGAFEQYLKECRDETGESDG